MWVGQEGSEDTDLRNFSALKKKLLQKRNRFQNGVTIRQTKEKL